MGTTIKLKSKATGSGAPTTLAKSEPAFDLANKRLYTASDAVNTIIEVGTEPSQLTCTGTVAFTGATTVKSFISHTIKDDESTDTDPSAIEIKPIALQAGLFQSDFLDLSTKSAPSTSEENNSLTITYRPTFMGTGEANASRPGFIQHIWNFSDHFPNGGGALLNVQSPRFLFQQPLSDTVAKGATNFSINSYSPLPRDDGFSTDSSTATLLVTGSSGFDDESVIRLDADTVIATKGIGLGDAPTTDVSGTISFSDWEYFEDTLVTLNLTGNTTIDCSFGSFPSASQNFKRLRIIRNGYTLSFTNVEEWINGVPTFNQNVHYLEVVRFYNTFTVRQYGTS